jgi:hypothetical protein
MMVRKNNTDPGGRDNGSIPISGPYNSESGKLLATDYKFALQDCSGRCKFALQDERKVQITFFTVLEHIVIRIQQTFKQGLIVADAIRNMTLPPAVLPTRAKPNNMINDPAVLARLSAIDLADYNNRVNRFNKCAELFECNMKKASALIYGYYCEPTMRDRIDEMMIADLTIRNNPIRLLVSIRDLMQEPMEHQDPVMSLRIQSILRIYTNESPTDYAKRVKQDMKIVMHSLDVKWGIKSMKHRPEYLQMVHLIKQLMES